MTERDIRKLKDAFELALTLGSKRRMNELTEYDLRNLLAFGIETGVMRGRELGVDQARRIRSGRKRR